MILPLLLLLENCFLGSFLESEKEFGAEPKQSKVTAEQ